MPTGVVMVLFAMMPGDDEAVVLAREWIKAQGLTSADARLVKRDEMVLVIDKGDAWRRLKAIS